MDVPSQTVAAIAEMRARIHDKLFNQRDFSDFGRVYARDATILPLGAPALRGREQILAYWQQAQAAFNLESAVLVPERLEWLGAYVLEIGHATITDGTGRDAAVKYLILWVEEEGGWKLYLDMWNLAG
jgi:ketosteroid isomerase-like protein